MPYTKEKNKIPASHDFFSLFLNSFSAGFKKIPWKLGKNAFSFILIFVILEIIFGELLYYQYVIMVEMQEPNIADISLKFHENTYQSVIKEWQARQNNVNNNGQINNAQ